MVVFCEPKLETKYLGSLCISLSLPYPDSPDEEYDAGYPCQAEGISQWSKPCPSHIQREAMY